MGYSDPGPLPRNAQRFAEELHTLLLRADGPGPYVLVGHSLGGLPVRLFAHRYAAEVAGVVLVESMSPSQAKPSVSATPAEEDAHSFADWALTLPARTGLGMSESMAQAGAVHSLGALPLIVLSRGEFVDPDPEWTSR
jgi:pimeloyl-ACP methyl ester carboxylesterase